MNVETDSISTGHNINVVERQGLSISGVTKIVSFDSDEFIIDTTCGKMGIKGKNLEIVKLDTYAGSISIKGTIDVMSYLTKEKSSNEGFVARLFK